MNITYVYVHTSYGIHYACRVTCTCTNVLANQGCMPGCPILINETSKQWAEEKKRNVYRGLSFLLRAAGGEGQ